MRTIGAASPANSIHARWGCWAPSFLFSLSFTYAISGINCSSAQVPRDKDGQKDLYTLVVSVYRNGWYVLIYVLCMGALGYHLLHGFFSAARTLGFYNARYVGWVKIAGWIYSIGISVGFALIPLYIHFARL
jgi:hypothetical protein